MQKHSSLNFKTSSLTLMGISFLFDLYLTFRSYTKLKNRSELPEKFKKYDFLEINPEEFIKNRSYNMDKKRFEVIKSTFDFIFSFLWISLNILSSLWNNLSEKYPGVYKVAFVYMVIHSLISTVFSTCFNYYHDFVIEEKHGFNKKTRSLFFMDLIKSFLIEAIFQFLVSAILIYFLEKFQDRFIFFAWVSVMLIVCVYIFIYPTYIAPMFNKFENLNEEDPKEKELNQELIKLCEKLQFPLGHIYKIDGKKRSDHSQAYFFGFFGKKQIVVYDTLIEKVTVPEIVAIVGHELGHWYHRHNIYNIVFTFANLGLVFYVFSYIMNNNNLYTDFELANKSYFMGLIIFAYLYSPISILTQALMCFVIRTNEYQADQFSVRRGMGQNLMEGLAKIFKDNKSDLDPDEVVALFRHTHPNFIDRVEAIQAEMKKIK